MSLLFQIEQCLRRTELSPTRFGRSAVGDPRLVFDLRRGREPRRVTEHRIRQYIASLEGAPR